MSILCRLRLNFLNFFQVEVEFTLDNVSKRRIFYINYCIKRHSNFPNYSKIIALIKIKFVKIFHDTQNNLSLSGSQILGTIHILRNAKNAFIKFFSFF